MNGKLLPTIEYRVLSDTLCVVGHQNRSKNELSCAEKYPKEELHHLETYKMESSTIINYSIISYERIYLLFSTYTVDIADIIMDDKITTNVQILQLQINVCEQISLNYPETEDFCSSTCLVFEKGVEYCEGGLIIEKERKMLYNKGPSCIFCLFFASDYNDLDTVDKRKLLKIGFRAQNIK